MRRVFVNCNCVCVFFFTFVLFDQRGHKSVCVHVDKDSLVPRIAKVIYLTFFLCLSVSDGETRTGFVSVEWRSVKLMGLPSNA